MPYILGIDTAGFDPTRMDKNLLALVEALLNVTFVKRDANHVYLLPHPFFCPPPSQDVKVQNQRFNSINHKKAPKSADLLVHTTLTFSYLQPY